MQKTADAKVNNKIHKVQQPTTYKQFENKKKVL